MDNQYSINDNQNDFEFPIINKKQILLDWINTIDEPYCLIVSSIKDLYNGRVFIELIRHLLTLNNSTILLSELNMRLNSVKQNNPYHIIFIAIDFFSKVSNDNLEILNNLKNNINNCYKDENFFIDFIFVIKNIYDNYYNNQIQYPEKDINIYNEKDSNKNDYNIENKIQNLNIENNNNFNHNKNQNIPKYNFNKDLINNKSNLEQDENLNRPKYNFNKEFINTLNSKNNLSTSSDISKNIKSIQEGNINNTLNNNEINQFQTMPNYNNSNYGNINEKINKSDYKEREINNQNNVDNLQKDFTLTPLLNDNYIPYNENQKQFRTVPNKNKFVNEKKNVFLRNNQSKSNYQNFKNSNLLSNIPNYRNRQIVSENNIQYNMNKVNSINNNNLFSNEEKNSGKKMQNYINMTRGFEIMNNNLYHIDIKSLTYNYFKFFKFTEPIIEISYDDVIKYKIISGKNIPNNNFNNNNKIIKKLVEKRNYELNPDNKRNIIIEKIEKKPEQESKLLSYRNLINKNIKDSSKEKIINPINENIKNKIYLWLIEIGLIKGKNIKKEDIPNLFSNGILFCDLINRLEGKNEIIKGIIRKIKKKSEAQININKFLNYLKDIEKFPSRHLWSNNEIYNGDEDVIFELLEDICNFYSKFFFKNVNRNKSNSKLNTEKNDIQNNIFNNLIFNNKINLDLNISDITAGKNKKENEKSNIEKKKEILKKNILNISNSINSNFNNLNHLNDNDNQMFNLNLKKPIYREKSSSTNQKKKINKIQKNKNLNNKINGSTLLFNLKDMTNSTINNNSYFTSSREKKINNSCFILFEKESAKRMKNKIEKINQYNESVKNNPNSNKENKSSSLLMNLIME